MTHPLVNGGHSPHTLGFALITLNTIETAFIAANVNIHYMEKQVQIIHKYMKIFKRINK